MKQKFKKNKRKLYTSILLFSGIFLMLFNIHLGDNMKLETCFVQATTPPSTNPVANSGNGPVINDVNAIAGIASFSGTIKWILFSIIAFFAWLITFGITLIDFTLTPEFQSILRMNAVKEGWEIVRDFLNIAFIFFLLFSAFATIFQVSKYHIKSTWVMIVVMALLVNFSWPISRIIIDISNVTMAYIIGDDNINGGVTSRNALMATIGEGSGFAAAIIGVDTNDPKLYNATTKTLDVVMKETEWVNLFMGIVFSFMFMVTVMAIAMILVIRTIALAVLIIFASVGFIAAAFPSTKSFSSSWWSSLLKYAFIGPILIFMLFLSSKIMMEVASNPNSEYNQGVQTAMNNNAKGTSEELKASIIHGMKFIVPIIILWTGIIAAGKLGDGASSMVLGMARSAPKRAWGATKWGSKNTAKGVDYGMGAAVNRVAKSDNKIVSGVGKGMANVRSIPDRIGNINKKRKESYEDVMAETKARALNTGGPGGDKNALKKNEDKQVAKEMKKIKEDGFSIDTMMSEVSTTDEGPRQTALLESMANHKQFGKGDSKNYVQITDMFTNMDKGLRGSLEGKLKNEGKGQLVAQNLAKEVHAEARESGNPITHKESLEKASIKVFGGMDGKTLAKQDVWKKGGIDNVVMRKVAEDRVNSDEFGAKQKQEFSSSMTKEMHIDKEAAETELATRRRETEERVADVTEQENLRDMNT